MREYRVVWNDMKQDKGRWETTVLEQAVSCFMDYLKEGYSVSFQTVELRDYSPPPDNSSKAMVKKTKKDANAPDAPKQARKRGPNRLIK